MILKEDILSIATEKQIMEFYWGERLTDNKAIYKNPMRFDGRGTCYFRWNGDKYMFVDRARGIGANFDCFKYVMWLHDCNFYEAMIRINNDMVLGAASKVLRKVGEHKDHKKRKRSNVSFKIKLRNWNQDDIDYWSQYHISLDNLDKIAKPVNSYSSNAGSVSFRLKYRYKADDPCYMYSFNKSKKVKLYQPHSEYNKWKSNTSVYDIFGYEHLPHFGDELYIVSGGKDMLCMWEMGYNAVAPQSEGSKIPDNLMKDLKSRFKNIYYLYDNDTTGIKMSTKFAEEHKVNNIILPTDTIGLYKDVADFCKGMGLSNTKDIIENVKRQNQRVARTGTIRTECSN
jgi:hypothetical protein